MKKLTLKEAYERATVRFVAKVNKRGPDECWLWAGGMNAAGYGVFYASKTEKWLAHRFAFTLEINRTDLDSFCVLHKCDNPPCCNPAHLFLGTRGDNNRDCWSKGRRRHWLLGCCTKGHPLTSANTHVWKDSRRGTQRVCKICRATRSGEINAQRQRRRALAKASAVEVPE